MRILDCPENSEQVIFNLKTSEASINGQILILEDYFLKFTLAGKLQDAIDIFDYLTSLKSQSLAEEISGLNLKELADNELFFVNRMLDQVQTGYFF